MNNTVITIIDYGYGNLFSINSAITKLGFNTHITNNFDKIINAKLIILPGVGSFQQAMEAIKSIKIDLAIKKALSNGSKLLGICLGYQMLFEESEEFGICKGLGFLQGKVVSLKSLDTTNQRVPNVGWRPIILNEKNSFLKKNFNKEMFYFVHSFVPIAKNIEKVSTFIKFGETNIHSSIHSDNIVGFQYHPEKSGEVGLRILRDSIEQLLQ